MNTDEETHECRTSMALLPWGAQAWKPTEILQLFSPLRRQETARKRPAEPYPVWLSPPLPALKHYLIRGPSGLTSWFFSLLGRTELDIPPSTTSTSHSKLPKESKPCTHTHTCTHARTYILSPLTMEIPISRSSAKAYVQRWP